MQLVRLGYSGPKIARLITPFQSISSHSEWNRRYPQTKIVENEPQHKPRHKIMPISEDQLDGIFNLRLPRSGSFFFRFAFPGFDDYNDVNVDL